MPDLTLTPHQQEALDWLVAHILDAKPLVALRGLAGTGKTTLIPHLRAALETRGLRSVVGSPTHRAAMLLRRKGIPDASTVHEHALMPFFTPDYVRALRWLGESAECQLDPPPQPDVDGLPWLVHQHCQAALDAAKALPRQRPRVSGRKLLSSIGLHGQHFFAGFGPKRGEGVLIVDEASMVGKSMLDLCQQAYQQIILVGDPGQLPPVKDQAVLSLVEGTDLSEIHRQAADSPIIQLAYRARQGEHFWRGSLTQLGDLSTSEIVEVPQADPAAFLDSPLIVHRNTTRIACTKAIRKALGYNPGTLYPGEPLVCRATSQADRALGFYNNGLYRVTAADPTTPRLLTVEDADGEEYDIQIHVEELDGENIHPEAIPFRFGYCLTAHTAQGGEWPTVYISLPDLHAYVKGCLARKQTDALTQWSYTAITRAKDRLCFLTAHHFERMEPMATPAPSRDPADPFAADGPESPALFPPRSAPGPADLVVQALPDAPDDIPDPTVPDAALADTPQQSLQEASGSINAPETVPDTSTPVPPNPARVEPQALGFLQWLQGEVHKGLTEEKNQLDRHLEYLFDYLKTWWQTYVASQAHTADQLSGALIQLQQHGLNTAPPAVAQVDAVSPEGFPVKFVVTKARMMEPETSAEAGLLQVVPTLLGWLQANGYQPPVAAPVPSELTF